LCVSFVYIYMAYYKCINDITAKVWHALQLGTGLVQC